MPTNAELVDYLMPISTNYVLGGSRYSPYNTDCSGVVDAAFWHVFDVYPWALGDWTGSQWTSSVTEQIWRGTSPYLPFESMQKGDLIFTSTLSSAFDTVNGSHVGFYTGNPDAPFLSHFANGGPYVTAVNGVYRGNERYFGVKRYMPGSEDNMEAHEVWDYNYESTAPKGNMYNCVVDIHKNAQPNKVWEYNYNGIAPGGNMFNCLVDTHRKVEALEKAVEKIEIGGAAVDYDKLAEAVADKLAKRMAD